MILANGRVMTDNFELVCCDIRIENDKIVELGKDLQGGERMDMTGRMILPGFIDTHIHGACGTRISDDDAALTRITRFEATQGVTGMAITTASSEFSDILRQIDAAAAVKENEGTKILGIHAEGPFLCKKYKGAMNEEYIIPPQKALLDEMMKHAGGLLKIITVAPEAEGAVDFIRYAVSQGIKVSMGHTNATYEEAMAGIAAGASRMTHTFNAARPLNHRDPGVLGAALTEPDVTCEMICDHVHLHPAVMQLIYRTKGADRISVISDSGHAAGWDQGVHGGRTDALCGGWRGAPGQWYHCRKREDRAGWCQKSGFRRRAAGGCVPHGLADPGQSPGAGSCDGQHCSRKAGGSGGHG